jgi:hypothetical protein
MSRDDESNVRSDEMAQDEGELDTSASSNPHGVRALLQTALYDTDGERVEGALVDH